MTIFHIIKYPTWNDLLNSSDGFDICNAYIIEWLDLSKEEKLQETKDDKILKKILYEWKDE